MASNGSHFWYDCFEKENCLQTVLKLPCSLVNFISWFQQFKSKENENVLRTLLLIFSFICHLSWCVSWWISTFNHLCYLAVFWLFIKFMPKFVNVTSPWSTILMGSHAYQPLSSVLKLPARMVSWWGFYFTNNVNAANVCV